MAMRRVLRRPFAAVAGVVTAIAVVYVLLGTSPTRAFSRTPWVPAKSFSFNKTVVVASLKEHDTSWVHTELPDWNKVIYVVDDPNATYHTSVNKGNEANVYLQYIIDNYDYLPQSMVFIHHHLDSAHIGWAFNNNSDMVRHLSLGNLQKLGYISLSCWNEHSCNIDKSSFWNSAVDGSLAQVWPTLFPEQPMPEVVTSNRYAQFGVSRDQVRARPKADYERYQDWLLKTDWKNYASGRVFEYTWHVIFGKAPFYCLSEERCFCEGYEICDLDKHRDDMKAINEAKEAQDEENNRWLKLQMLLGFSGMKFDSMRKEKEGKELNPTRQEE